MKVADMIRWSVLFAGCFSLSFAAQAVLAADPAQELQRADIKALQRAIEDLAATYGDGYPRGARSFSSKPPTMKRKRKRLRPP